MLSSHRLMLTPLGMVLGLHLAPAAIAGVLGPGQAATVNQGQVPEAWTLNGATLSINPGASSLNIGSIFSTVNIDGGTVEDAGTAIRLQDGSTALLKNATVKSADSIALLLSNANDQTRSSNARIEGGSFTGARYGVSVGAAGTVIAQGATMAGTGTDGVGLGLFQGTAEIREGSTVKGQLNGVRIRQDERGSSGLPSLRSLIVDASRIEGITGSGISVDTLLRQGTETTISIANGSEVIGGNGTAIELLPERAGNSNVTVKADITVDASTLQGDVRADTQPGTTMDLSLRLQNGSTMNGAMSGSIAATVSSMSVWNVTAGSNVDSLALDGGQINFRSAGSSHLTTTVRGGLSGSGGVLSFNTVMNEGGALSNQQTDRLLVQGDVTTTGPTEIVVVPSGGGANTDLNNDGVVDAHEGISLVQVGGDSRADAFVLRGGYVAAGPYQYTLHAFGPGRVDQAQNALPSGQLNWDYRLGNRYVCQDGCGPVDPEEPGEPGGPDEPGNPGGPDEPGLPEPGPGREAVVPQVPSYLSAPAALLTYGDLMTDGLHQRLGDIRQGATHDPIGGEVFARYLGGQMRYNSNRSFGNYGYDFDQQVNALQLGGSLVALDGDNGNLRIGWAADHGTTRVTPKAADGNSFAKYRANGVSGWATWQHGGGLWVDGVVSAIRYRGDVGTDFRGQDVGRIRANGWTMSVEAGKPFALAHEWTLEPRFQLKHQQLNFRDFRDADGLDVRLGTAKQTSATIGARISRTANPLLMPYASLDLTHTSNGDPSVDVSSEAWNAADRFRSGRVGNGYRVSAGAVSQIGKHVQLYGEANYRHAIGSYGMRGLAGNLGIRVTF